MSSRPTVAGYLPNDRPAPARLLLFGLQHVVTMFPAAVLVALLCGFHVDTVLFGSGVSTLVALALSRRRLGTFIPLYYGSSFSYIAAYLGVAQAAGWKVQFGVPLPDDVLAVMQTGIVVTGLVNVAVGLVAQRLGRDAIERVMPPVVTGAVACAIGIGLAKAALDMALTAVPGTWGIALATLAVTLGASHLLRGRGLAGMLPILLGAAAGIALTAAFVPGALDGARIREAPLVALPHWTWPALTGELLPTAVFSIAVMAVATIPESTAHLFQMSLYVDRLADEQRRERIGLDRFLGFNLVCDGIGDVVSGLFGSTAGTNYGENNSLMAITRNYSGWALAAAGGIAVALGLLGKLSAAIATVPVFVSGGLALYLFGVIGMQGIALMKARDVDFFDPLQLGLGAVVLTVGVGGTIGFEGGFLPIVVPGVFPHGLPALATAALLGIGFHLLFALLGRLGWRPGPAVAGRPSAAE